MDNYHHYRWLLIDIYCVLAALVWKSYVYFVRYAAINLSHKRTTLSRRETREHFLRDRAHKAYGHIPIFCIILLSWTTNAWYPRLQLFNDGSCPDLSSMDIPGPVNWSPLPLPPIHHHHQMHPNIRHSVKPQHHYIQNDADNVNIPSLSIRGPRSLHTWKVCFPCFSPGQSGSFVC